ncbi:MAG TPA: LacI family transcriptional regulator, partial [Synergistetes bacterium]|nr:LacI family transcriptional regulator [Synergistota bacterium]
MSDVAAAAGVNKATVSRVLRGDPRISSSTAEKVWETIKKLGYRPDAIARGLSSRRSDTLGLFFRD